MASKFEDAIEEARETGMLYFSMQESEEPPPIEALLSEIRKLPHLRRLILLDVPLQGLPDWFSKLTRLEILCISRGKLFNFPPVLTKMIWLRELSLTSCELTDISPSIGALSNLTFLGLSGNRTFKQLPESIGDLNQLQVLDLGGCPLTSLPASVGHLQKLTHLYMWGHNFKDVPDALRSLNALQVLDLSAGGSNELRESDSDSPMLNDDPPIIAWSRTVGISANDGSRQLTSLPSWMPASFPGLRKLYVGGHHINEVPESFFAMQSLRELFLSGNELRNIPEAIMELPELEKLDFRGNSITSLPLGLQCLHKLDYLDLAGNPLPIPPEILDRPFEPRAILEFAFRLGEVTKPLNEAKLLIVGEGAVGKTSLVKRLVHNTYSVSEGKTEGIAVTRWPIMIDGTEIALNVWDFGGQEIMHATHQFFLTKRSAYVLVIDARQGEEQNRIEYWLKLIQSFSNNSPVVIVGNKSDESALDVDRRGLQSKYANIVGIISVSCLTGNGIDEIKAILAQVIGRLSHVRDALPIAFFEIKQHLENLSANYLTFAEYEQLCVSKGITTKSTQELLIEFLHDLGTVLCFRDDPRLSDTNILNPSWVTGGVYRLLNSNLASLRKGLLTWRDINEILESDDYPTERRSFIIDMMKKFELCYEADQLYLIPDLLTKEEPDTGAWDDALHFEIKYDVLPSSVISRLIVRMNASISKGTVWRTGMVLTLDRNRALVKGDREDAVLTIDVAGSTNGRRGLLTAVRTELRGIERTIPGLVGEERVPVPGHPGIWVPYSHLLDLEIAGRQTVVPQGLTEDFSVRELLAGIETPADRLTGRVEEIQDNSRAVVTVDEVVQASTGQPGKGFFLWTTPWRRAGTILVGLAGIAGAIAAIVALFIK
jgi:internalin A